jgi:hypothetical protein
MFRTYFVPGTRNVAETKEITPYHYISFIYEKLIFLGIQFSDIRKTISNARGVSFLSINRELSYTYFVLNKAFFKIIKIKKNS